jgi:hypothetical protein
MRARQKRQYTIRNIPTEVDRALRRRAECERRSLNEVAVDALRRGAGLAAQPSVHHDLDHLIGTWVEDPAFDAAIAAQDVVDERLWR